MENYKRMVVLLAAGASLLLASQRTGGIPQSGLEESKPLTWVLIALGEDYNCFFTLEEAWQEGEAAVKLESASIRRSTDKGGLIQELEKVRQNVPDFSYEFNPVNPRVVHVIDARLKRQKSYALDGTITKLDFNGAINGLPNEIQKQGIRISTPTGQDTHEHRDGTTIVHVSGDGLSVRDALSNFINLDGRGKILWIARTKLDPGAISYVFYPWPGKIER